MTDLNKAKTKYIIHIFITCNIKKKTFPLRWEFQEENSNIFPLEEIFERCLWRQLKNLSEGNLGRGKNRWEGTEEGKWGMSGEKWSYTVGSVWVEQKS